MLRAVVIALVVVSAALAALYGIGTARIARVETVDDATVAPAPGARFIQTRSGRVHYLDVGSGPPLLLMHGSGRSIADWQQGAVAALAERHRVVAFDDYGLGFSERSPAFTYGYDLWVQEAVDLLDALQIDHVTVVGHSVGGALACILAADHPERVDHVMTIGTGMAIEPAQFLLAVPGVGENELASMGFYGDVSSPEQRKELEAAYRIKGTRAALLTYIRRQMTVDGVRLLFGVFEDIKVPVLHVSGSRDRNIPPEIARRLADRTHGSFVSIEGAGHGVQVDAPRQLAQVIEDFLVAPRTSR